MTVKELKDRIKPGMMIRLVRGAMKHQARCDILRVVVAANSVGWQMEGEGILPSKAPMYVDWPKAKELKTTEAGFEIHKPGAPVLGYEWVEDDNPTPKDRACRFILNTFEHCTSEVDAILALGDYLGNHEAAEAVVRGYRNLEITLQHALEKPEACDRSLRLWLDTVWDWSYVPQTV